MAEYRQLADPHPQWENFPHNLPPNTRILRMNRDRLPINPRPGLEIEEFDVPAHDGYPIRVRSYRQTATTSQAALPLLIYLHGGGFVTGGLETDDEPCRDIASEIPILVLNVEYRLAPEHPFPVGFTDCLDVVLWASSPRSQSTLPTNLSLQSGFLIGGTSAGANFTFGIAHLVAQTHKSELLHPVTGILFLAGTICHEDARLEKYADRILSIDELTSGPGLSKKSIQYFAGVYQIQPLSIVVYDQALTNREEKYRAPPTDVRRSPLLFESHSGLAQRAVVYACGWDPRRDETLLVEEILRAEGVATKKYIYPGLPHGFWGTCPDLEESKRWKKDLLNGVRFLLEGRVA